MGCTTSAEIPNNKTQTHAVCNTGPPVDDYVKEKVLGVGASCEVIVARKKSNDKLYAVKILKRAEKGDAVSDSEYLFKNEVHIMKRLHHPNIVEFVESFESPQCFKLVTALCLGGELFDRVSEGSFSERSASRLAKQMLSAIAHCHEKHIVHRDLKPENFVFETKAADSNMKLIDFGCALLVEDDEVVKDVAGSPYYVAPEVLVADFKRTGRIWKAADMWSIGVIVYLLVHGYPPFNGDMQEAIFRKIRVGKYKFSRDIPLSNNVKDFISSLLVMDPMKRMTAKQALEHPWIANNNKVPDTPIPPAVVQSLNDFRTKCRLKKAVGKVLAGRMSPDDEKALELVFKQFDTNGDGTLDAQEIAAMMKHIGKSPAEAKQLMDEIDENGDGVVSREELKTMYVMGKLTTSQDDVKKAFEMFDLDGDGFVTHDEIEKICHGLSPDVAKQLIADVDKNGDGRINFNEWLAAMTDMKAAKAPKGKK